MKLVPKGGHLAGGGANPRWGLVHTNAHKCTGAISELPTSLRKYIVTISEITCAWVKVSEYILVYHL